MKTFFFVFIWRSSEIRSSCSAQKSGPKVFRGIRAKTLRIPKICLLLYLCFKTSFKSSETQLKIFFQTKAMLWNVSCSVLIIFLGNCLLYFKVQILAFNFWWTMINIISYRVITLHKKILPFRWFPVTSFYRPNSLDNNDRTFLFFLQLFPSIKVFAR